MIPDLPGMRKYSVPLWQRIAAFIIDILIIDIFLMSPWNRISESLIGKGLSIADAYQRINSGNQTALIAMMIFLSVLALSYFALMQYVVGKTVGMMIFNIEVKGEDEKEPSFWQCIVRNLFIMPILPFIIFWVADPLYYFLARKDQRLLEALSKTKIVGE